MAISKNGGTRSRIRGRVGSEVYSIGKDALGKKQQVIRAIAEQVSNPQSLSQMRQRMYMATVQQAKSALKVIVDHSFDNVTGVIANLSQFVSKNLPLIKADALAHPSTNNTFGLVAYQEKGIKQGPYIISNGTENLPEAVSLVAATGSMVIALGATDATIATLKSVLGMSSSEYLTLVGITAESEVEFTRLRIDSSVDDSTAISTENLDSIFLTEGNAAPTMTFANGNITIMLTNIANCCGIIVSRKALSGYRHNTCQLTAPSSPAHVADVAIATYPIGDAMFLNGGDVNGMSETGGEATEPEVTDNPPVMATLMFGSDSVLADTTSIDTEDVTRNVTYTTSNADFDSGYSIVTAATSVSVGDTIASNLIVSSLAVNSQSGSGSMSRRDSTSYTYFYLIKDYKVIAKYGRVYHNEDGGGE